MPLTRNSLWHRERLTEHVWVLRHPRCTLVCDSPTHAWLILHD